ncbi:ATP-binding protein [Mesorhizobium qingshengii]|uniref:Helicase HerA central domain-containing protein n=1 Tax=Mesorhizobium qingshengii TaxID=1165689 RepID=A0A1G5W1Q5_9HYPH|nr:DUF87 domain-containing protein [Mesorhizobium qingshengii]SDA51864.1 hypothetical protein SAMN02927914_01042 [Mesorhizobium qingshengii]
MDSEPRIRAIALAIYLAALLAVQYECVNTGLSPNENAIWLYGGIASLLFGSRLLNPYFTAPADAATNGFVALMAILPAFPIIKAGTTDAYVLGAITAFCGFVSAGSVVVIIARRSQGAWQGRWVSGLDRAVKGLGSPNIIFSALIIAAVWLFHRDRPHEVFAIMTALAAIVIFRPFESAVAFFVWLANLPYPIAKTDIVGSIAAYQSPGIVLIRQNDARRIPRGTPMVISDQHGPPQLGVALNYVGRDEGNLLRAVTAPLPASIASRVSIAGGGEDGIAVLAAIEPGEAEAIPALQWVERLCGIVDSDTTLEYMQFEVVDESGLSEGCLVEARIGDQRSVIYQIIEGLTREEIVQQKNKYGYARAKARKIGAWNHEDSKFAPVPWLPRINAPVFLMKSEGHEPEAASIGHFPNTPYGVRVDISPAVSHNTAILGILGVGKSYLAIELVERMIAEGIKVFCLDLTNQYEVMLSDFISPVHEAAKRDELIAAGRGGKPDKNRQLGGSINDFKKAVLAQLKEFASGVDDHFLRIVNPAQFVVTKQPSFMKDGDAELMRLSPSEITAVFSEAALIVCQELGMTDKARMCLVYEEAHTLVPEWNSVAQEGDRTATASSARAILQGRKYGLGCLLITQRTANVTKTILNQCNTIFAMRTFDDTGREFLGNYIGSDYASVLPSLQPRYAVIFGKASSCENPVLVRLNDNDDFRNVFRPIHPPKKPQDQDKGPDAEAAAAEGAQIVDAGALSADEEEGFFLEEAVTVASD